MKTKIIVLISFLMLVVSGCIVKSLHPFYFDKDVVINDDLVGTWLDQDSTKWIISRHVYTKTFMGQETTGNSYRVEILEEDDTKSVFNVHVFKLKDNLFFDFYPDSDGTVSDNMAGSHFIPGHSFANLKIYGKHLVSLNWASEQWLDELFTTNRIKISHEVINEGGKIAGESPQYILTASTKELQKFLIKYSPELDVFKYFNNPPEGSNDEEKFHFFNSEIKRLEKDKRVEGHGLIMNLIKQN